MGIIQLSDWSEKALLKAKEKQDIDNYHKSQDNTQAERELGRYYLLTEFTDLGVKCEVVHQGILIEDKYIVAWQQNKWRVQGKGKWYYYKTPKQMVDTYIRRNK
jgi:hypothetical protein